MKSLANSILEVAEGVLMDVSQTYPDSRRSFERDLEKLTLLVKHRGLGIFTLDLPKLDDSLLAGLELGRLKFTGFAKAGKLTLVPRLFSGLWLRVFDKSGCLRDDPDVNSIAFLRQLLTLGKKIEVPCSKRRESQAIQEYINVENRLRPPSLRWDADTLGLDGDRLCLHLRDCLDADLPLFPQRGTEGVSRRVLLERCQRIFDIISGELGFYSPDAVIDARQEGGTRLGLRHGPGAVAETKGRYFNKYDFSNWSAKLGSLYPFQFFGRMLNDSERNVRNHEVPARLICVPKTAKGPRIIAAEPSEHMYVQKLLESWLLERTNDTFIGAFVNFRKQELSQQMVKRASCDRSLATVDLSSASDRLSLWLIERAFRKNTSLVDAIHASRTRWIHIPQRNEFLKLKKFASQGTAITFPIQTLVFLGIALAASLPEHVDYNDPSKLRSAILRLRGRVRVYGDDIIIPVYGYVRISCLLHTLGLKMNLQKSFFRGFFRESCGMDSYKGYDVTPVKPKHVMPDNPASCVATLDASNNLFLKGYWNAASKLQNRLYRDPTCRFPTVGRDAGATGFRSFSFDPFVAESIGLSHRRESLFGERSEKLRTLLRLPPRGRLRYNSQLQRVELRAWTVRSCSKTQPFHCGYTGILEGSLLPLEPQAGLGQSGIRGVPARPRLRKEMRWVALSDLIR